MPPTITRAQSDAIYEAVIAHLSAIGDVWFALENRDFATAKRIGRESAEDLRLLDDLGWAETTDRQAIALSLPTGELTPAGSPACTTLPQARSAHTSRGPKTTRRSRRATSPPLTALAALLAQVADPPRNGHDDGEEVRR